MSYEIKPKVVALWLGGIATYLALQSVVAEFLLEKVLGGGGETAVVTLIDLLSVNVEESIPTWFSTLLLFATAVLLFFIWGVKRRQQAALTPYWLGLAITFVYLSMDEGAAIHETVVDPLSQAFNPTGYLTFAWQIIFFPLVLLFALIYLRFLWRLPRRTAKLMVAAGIVYVGGAVFIEAISANQWYLHDGVTFRYLAIATVEEWFEMLGATLMIYTLLDYVVAGRYTAVLRFIPAMRINFAPSPILLKTSLAAVLLLNGVLFGWSLNQRPLLAQEERPFYEAISEDYADRGVIILQYQTPLTDRKAEALLTLFDEVLLVNDPVQQSLVVFAGQRLPFDKETVSAYIEQAGIETAVILNHDDLREMESGQ